MSDIKSAIESIEPFSKTRPGCLLILRAIQPSPENAGLYEEVLRMTEEVVQNPQLDILKDYCGKLEESADPAPQESEEVRQIINKYTTLEHHTRKVLESAQFKPDYIQQFLQEIQGSLSSVVPTDTSRIPEKLNRMKAMSRMVDQYMSVFLGINSHIEAQAALSRRFPEYPFYLKVIKEITESLQQESGKHQALLQQHYAKEKEYGPEDWGAETETEDERAIQYLPIGTVVLLRQSTKEVMIYGTQQCDSDTEDVYDYVGCPYPEGNIGLQYTFLFNHDIIDKVVFRGYSGVEKS